MLTNLRRKKTGGKESLSNDETFLGKFQNPGPEYRSTPFWAWNETLEPAEICRQLGLMKEGGYGGGFLHSRIGLITPYLGQEWMSAVKTAVNYAKKNNLLVYLYDEDRYPSGFAGGMVTKKKSNQGLALVARKNKKGQWFFKVEKTPSTEYFNNLPYLNTLKKEAVTDFIKSTYQLYYKEVGKEFGKTIPAIFTDEAKYICYYGANKAAVCVPYTDKLPKLFRQEYGYEITAHYASLFERTGDWQKIRHHYRRLVAKLFQQNFGKQIYDWCEKHNIALTGHYPEGDLESETYSIGAAMPLYEYMQLPGVDHCGNDINRDLLTLKQCSSVSHQLGRNKVLSELFGCSGQNINFLDRKWIGDWHFALGINFFCPHLWLYSMAGCRKRDYPPTLSYQQPWWPDNKGIEDYFARVGYLLSQGKFASDILVLHPIESGFILFQPGFCHWEYPFLTKELRDLNNLLVSLLEDLLSHHFEFDLGDETILGRHGQISGKKFVVGQLSYRVVILPDLITIRRSTLDLLVKFIRQGGKVIALNKLPKLVDGEKDEKSLGVLAAGTKILPNNQKSLLSELEGVLPERVRVKIGQAEAKNVYLYRRILSAEKETIFLTNTSKKDSQTVDLSLPAAGFLEEWDAFTGKVSPSGVTQDAKGIKKSLKLPVGGSALFILHRNKIPLAIKEKTLREKLIAESSTRYWKATPLGLNSLTLDTCTYCVGSQKWQAQVPILRVQQFLEKTGKVTLVSLRFTFKTNLKELPAECYLVLERPEQFKVKINNQTVNKKDNGFWVDTAFRKIDIKNNLRLQGENVVELETKFHSPKKSKTLIYRKNGTELESIYILGNFSVNAQIKKVPAGFWAKEFAVTDKSETTPINLVENGYPFYAGRFRYAGTIIFSPEGTEREKGRLFLQLIEPFAITHRVWVNGKDAGLILLPPYRIEVTGLLKEGENRMEIEAATSLRNLLGPHHHKLIGSAANVGPWSFCDDAHWVDDYHLVPIGLKGIQIFRDNMKDSK